MTQKALAKAVGTSQQQIQRIETSKQAVKMQLAAQICKALACNFSDAFPAAQGREQIVKNLKQEFTEPGESANNEEKTGLDADPLHWTLILMFRGGSKQFFPVSAGTVKRLRRVAEGRFPEFFCFDSENVQAAVNLNHVLHFHTIWDQERRHLQPKDCEYTENQIAVTIAGIPEPLKFGVDPDDQDDHSNRSYSGQLTELMKRLQEEPNCSEFIHFQDEDGEDAFFRVEDVALITLLQDTKPSDRTACL